jgi:serine/threonine protein kinase
MPPKSVLRARGRKRASKPRKKSRKYRVKTSPSVSRRALSRVASKAREFGGLSVNPKAQLLGRGVYGSVYSTADREGAKAIKYTKFSEDGLRDIHEMDMLMRAQHPNLLHAEYFIYNTPENEIGMMLPRAETDLEKAVNRGILSTEDKIRIAYEIISGLHALQSGGYYHCDIKPDNVLLHRRHALLSDYSLVRPNRFQLFSCHADHYQSPQRYVAYHKIPHDAINDDFSSFRETPTFITDDNWALGALLYFLFTGKHLMEVNWGLPQDQVDAAVIKEFSRIVANPDTALRRVHLEMRPVIKQLLAEHVYERFFSLDQLLKHNVFRIRGMDYPVPGSIVNLQTIPAVDCENPVFREILFLFSEQDHHRYLDDEVYYLAVDLAYRAFAALQPDTQYGADLLVAACLLLAHKVWSPREGLADSLVKQFGSDRSIFTRADLLAQEREIVEALDGVLLRDSVLEYLDASDRANGRAWILRNCEKYTSHPPSRLAEMIEESRPKAPSRAVYRNVLSRSASRSRTPARSKQMSFSRTRS